MSLGFNSDVAALPDSALTLFRLSKFLRFEAVKGRPFKIAHGVRRTARQYCRLAKSNWILRVLVERRPTIRSRLSLGFRV